jgi:hypothetical protein
MLPQGQRGQFHLSPRIGTTGPYLEPCVYQLNAFRTHTYCMTTASCGPAGTHFTVMEATERTAVAARGTRSVLKSASAEQLIGSTHGQSSIIRSRVMSSQKKKKLFLLFCEPQSLIQPRHSSQPCARPELAWVAHLRIAHLTNASFSGK